MAHGATSSDRVLYLTACDRHARSVDGSPMVAGHTFSAIKGCPALPWGCGPLIHFKKDAPRWLVLDPQEMEPLPGGALIKKASICFDGTKNDALRYLHGNGAAAMPYLGRRRRGGDYAVLTAGSMGVVEAEAHACAAGGDASELTLGLGATAAVSRGSKITAGEFSRVTAADHGVVATDRFSLVVTGMNGSVTAGDGALVLAGAMSQCAVGAGGRAMVDSEGSLDLGVRAVGVGRHGTRFRGADGALFVVIDVPDDGPSGVLTARVGEGGVKPNVWYHLVNNQFSQVSK